MFVSGMWLNVLALYTARGVSLPPRRQKLHLLESILSKKQSFASDLSRLLHPVLSCAFHGSFPISHMSPPSDLLRDLAYLNLASGDPVSSVLLGELKQLKQLKRLKRLLALRDLHRQLATVAASQLGFGSVPCCIYQRHSGVKP